MADTVQAGGLNYPVTADVSKFTEAMKKVEGDAKKAGDAMAKSFEDASKQSEKAIEESFGARVAEKALNTIKGLQTAGQAFGDFWTKGADEASDAIVNLVEKGKNATNDWLRDAAYKKSKLLGLTVDVFSGTISSLEDMAVKAAAERIGDNPDKVTEYVNAARANMLQMGRDRLAAQFDPESVAFTKGMEQAEKAADAFAAHLAEKAEAIKIAGQKLAGTYEGMGDDAKKLAARFDEMAAASKLATAQIGKDAAERSRIRSNSAIDALDPNGRERTELEGKRDVLADNEAAREAAQKADQQAKEYERTVTAVTSALKRQADMQLANADAASKTAKERALEQSAVMVKGYGRKGVDVSEDPRIAAERAADADTKQVAAQIKFNSELQEGLIRSTGAYQFQMQAIGATAGETARLRFEEEQLNAARKLGVELGLAETEAIRAGAAQRAMEAQSIAKATDAYRQFMEVGKTVASSLESAFARFTQTGKVSFSEMVKSMLLDLEKLAFRAALMPIFGGGAANPGGLFGDLFKSFGGGKAEGGPLESGKWYIAGERGPEPIWGGGAGAFAAGYGGGGGDRGGSSRSDINMTINLAGANGDETIARVAANAARQAYVAAVENTRASFTANSRSSRMLTA